MLNKVSPLMKRTVYSSIGKNSHGSMLKPMCSKLAFTRGYARHLVHNHPVDKGSQSVLFMPTVVVVRIYKDPLVCECESLTLW